MKPTSSVATELLRTFLLHRFPRARSHGIENDTPLLERGIIDSLGMLELIAYLEQEFAITVSDEDLTAEHFRSIDSLASFISSRLSEANR